MKRYQSFLRNVFKDINKTESGIINIKYHEFKKNNIGSKYDRKKT